MKWANIDAGQTDSPAPSSPGVSVVDLVAPESVGSASRTGACCASPVFRAQSGVQSGAQSEQAAVGTHWPAVSESPPGPTPLDHPQLTAALNHVISTELGLRGFMLSLAVEKAHSVAELRSVVERTVDQIRAQRGDAAAAAARRTLGGA